MRSFRRVIIAGAMGLFAAAPQAAPKKAAAPQPGAAPQRRGPASLKEVPRLEDAEKEARVAAKREEEIEQLKKIIPRFEDGSPQKADLLFNLSELYWQKSKQLYAQEM